MFSLGILLLSFGAIFLALGITSLVISEISNSVSDKKFGKNGWRKE